MLYVLYVISCKNHPELAYQGGQEPIVHLEADLRSVLEWANTNKYRWAFTLSNAGAVYAQFRKRRDEFDQVSWPAVNPRDFRPAHIKEGKQAEFLLKGFFPWDLVERIGVHSGAARLCRPKREVHTRWISTPPTVSYAGSRASGAS